MTHHRIDIPVGDPRVIRGIIATLEGHMPPDIGPEDGSDVPCQCRESREWATVQQTITDFITAERDLLKAQDSAATALKDPANEHCRCSEEAVDAYERKVEAIDKLAALLGVVIYSSARRR